MLLTPSALWFMVPLVPAAAPAPAPTQSTPATAAPAAPAAATSTAAATYFGPGHNRCLASD
jgi:hypothetical protein